MYLSYLAWLKEFESNFLNKPNRFQIDPTPSPEKQRVIELIRDAFANVRCKEERVLLYGGMALDDWQPAAVVDKLYAHELYTDWASIPPSRLAACWDCLRYIGPEATRFLLPAYMIFELSLTDLCIMTGLEEVFCSEQSEQADSYEGSCRHRLSLLNKAQQHAITEAMNIKRRYEWQIALEHDMFLDEPPRLLPWEWDDILSRQPPLDAQQYLDSLLD